MWLISNDAARALESAYSAATITAEQVSAFSAAAEASAGEPVVGSGTATIEVSGVLTKAPDIFAALFGGGNTTYRGLQKALAVAQADPDVKRVVLRIDSPGGQIAGLFGTIAAIQAFSKPIEAHVVDTAASAAYALAAATGTIVAQGRWSRLGSIGVATELRLPTDSVQIASTKAPKKRPNPATAEGQAAIREDLDALHDLFVETIAAGRGTTPDKVNADFGEGATLLAEEALKRGMIDAIDGGKPTATTTTASSGEPQEFESMDAKTLQAQHPAVYAEVMELGVAAERDRVCAHLSMAQASGLYDDAIAAVEGGGEITQTLTAKHVMAATVRAAQTAHVEEGEEASGALAGIGGNAPADAPKPSKADEEADAVFAALDSALDYTEGV